LCPQVIADGLRGGEQGALVDDEHPFDAGTEQTG
jgi:hypothetical protein